MDLNIIKKLIEILEESNLKKLSLRDGDFEVMIEKEDKHPPNHHHHPIEHSHIDHPHFESQSKTIKSTDIVNDTGLYIKSPMVGTFYSAPSPDQPPFVKVGDRVTEDTIVCVIEAMKVMNELKANMKGTIAEILIDNAHPVEFGTKLFRIVP